MNLTWKIVKLNLKETFSISYGNYSHRDSLIVSLNKYGKTGYGECTAIDYYGIDFSEFSILLEKYKQTIEAIAIQEPKAFYKVISNLKMPSFLKSALDCAFWDLYGKLENKSFLELNKIEVGTIPDSSLTISIASVEDQIKKMEVSSWSKFKIKTKGFDLAALEKLTQLNNVSLDSNGSYTKYDCNTLQSLALAGKFDYIEQPMPVGQYQSLQNNGFANWMADEDCQDSKALQKLKPYYSSINIKLVKCGGLTPALELIAEAKKLGYKIMIGCMTESTVGISAGATLAPLVDYCDLDGAFLVANDIAKGTKVENGKIFLSDKPGLGIELL